MPVRSSGYIQQPTLKRIKRSFEFFRRRFALSPAESRVATFVVCILAGSAVLRAWNVYYPAKTNVPHDFSAIDSVFTSRTAAMADAGCGTSESDDSTNVFSTDKPLQKKTLPALHSVDLNIASAEMLKNLPNIGPAMAERIIAFRKNTPFRSVAELQRVHGIGKKKFAHIEPYVKAE